MSHFTIVALYIICFISTIKKKTPSFIFRIVALPGNSSNNLWILDFMLGLLDKSSCGITINYYTRNLTVLQCTYNLVITLEIFTGWPLVFFCRDYSHLSETTVCRCIPILLTLCNWNCLHTRYITTAPTTQKTSPPPLLTRVYWVIA
jgi:hypothetical protein